MPANDIALGNYDPLIVASQWTSGGTVGGSSQVRNVDDDGVDASLVLTSNPIVSVEGANFDDADDDRPIDEEAFQDCEPEPDFDDCE